MKKLFQIIFIILCLFSIIGTKFNPISEEDAANLVGTIDGDRLVAPTATKKGGVPATGEPSGKFLKDDGTWAAGAGGAAWGSITGTLSAQTDLSGALDGKAPSLGANDNYVTDAEKTNLHANNISDVNATDLTDGGATTLHSHAGGSEAFPVGAVFIAIVNTNPNTLLGYGTWSAIAAGRVLVGLDSGDVDFDTVEETGGAKTVASSAQSFGGTELATHQHAAITAGTPAGTVGTVAATSTTAVKIGTAGATGAAQSHTHAGPTFTGSEMATHQHAAITAGIPSGTNTPGSATSVVQPYLVVYIWKRTS